MTRQPGAGEARRRRAIAGLVVGLGTAAAGGWIVTSDGGEPDNPPRVAAAADPPIETSTTVGAPPADPTTSTTVPPTTTTAAPSPPASEEDLPAPAPAVLTGAGRLRIDALGVEAAVVEVRVRPDGELEVPPDPSTVGWWAEGARPGGGVGSVVVDGHVDTARQGPGAFFRLGSMGVGDAVELTASDGSTHRYRVTATARYPKAELPVEEVFAQDGAERLVLITCGGDFDEGSRHYADNVVVFADPA